GRVVRVGEKVPGSGEGGHAVLFFHVPVLASVDGRFGSACALQNKAETITDLGDRGILSEIPDGGCDDVRSRLEEGGEDAGLISPVLEISTARAVAPTLLA